MKFSKLQATGNDFILVDARTPLHYPVIEPSDSYHPEKLKQAKNITLNRIDEESLWAKLAQSICKRRFGIGADGLILIQNSDIADLKMRIINSDGSEAETCGNGLRCFTKYAIENGIINKTNFTIETLSGISKSKAYVSGAKVNRVKVSMGFPQFESEQIPIVHTTNTIASEGAPQYPLVTNQIVINSYKLSVSSLSMGNPHAVAFASDSIANFPLIDVGPKIERHSLFPQRTNFEIARVLDRTKIEARVWERGVGETFACGSGACAIAIVAQLLGFVDRQVDITFPGGVLTIYWDRIGEVSLSGPVENVFSAEYQI
ncbi:MAG: diaminopimelate epimerase [Dehalococcoidia bacterium]|nr:diaminopimelate epimerase [Dehalococcoidia bacterium]